MIISRYLTKEIVNALLTVTLVLLLIFLSNQLIRFLSYAATGKLPTHILFHLMSFEIPYLLALLLPLGLYLGIILAYGRMYAESEMRVLHACGLSIDRLIMITSVLVLVVTAVVAVLTFWVNPLIAAEKEKLIAHSKASDNIFDSLMPGRFQVSGDGKRVLYVERISRNHKQAYNLFIASPGNQPIKKLKDDNSIAWSVVSAAHGSQMKEPVHHDRFVVATEGNRYEGMPGQNDFKIIQFKKYAVRMPHAEITSKRQQQEAIPTPLLWQHYQHPEFAAELQWRFSIPIMTFILGLLAIPMSHVRPRQGRFAQLLPALLIYIVYANLLFVARNWIEQKMIPIGFGMWWVHSLMLIGVAILLLFQTGNVKQFLRRTT